MPAEQVQQLLDQVTATGASAGVMFNFDSVRHTNTLRAHQALHHAAEHGLQSALLERLFRAYFTEGRHVGRDADLADLAAEVGQAGTPTSPTSPRRSVWTGNGCWPTSPPPGTPPTYNATSTTPSRWVCAA